MDKKKVIELIEQAIIWSRQANQYSVISNLEEALKELNKSDWVSVEDELPPYDKVVWVTSKMSPDNVFKNKRVECATVPNDSNGFIILWKGRMASITHWKPIEKLEE